MDNWRLERFEEVNTALELTAQRIEKLVRRINLANFSQEGPHRSYSNKVGTVGVLLIGVTKPESKAVVTYQPVTKETAQRVVAAGTQTYARVGAIDWTIFSTCPRAVSKFSLAGVPGLIFDGMPVLSCASLQY